MTSIRDIRGGHGIDRRSEVEFRFYRKEADQVWVVGDFTDWRHGRLAMRAEGNGWWCLVTPLPAGEYRFRYLADERNAEQWYTDFAAHGVEFAKGRWNGVLVVPRQLEIAERTQDNTQTMRLAA